MLTIPIHPVETTRTTFLPAVLAGSLCSTCGQATVCASCNRCHYCEDVDLPCGSSRLPRSPVPAMMTIPLVYFPSASNDDYRLAVLAGHQGTVPPLPPRGTGLLFAEDDGNDQEQPVDPALPINFDDLTDEQLAVLIRSLVAHAARSYHLGIFHAHLQPDRAGTTSSTIVSLKPYERLPVAHRASRFDETSQERGTK